jgi:hypothetical protein
MKLRLAQARGAYGRYPLASEENAPHPDIAKKRVRVTQRV